MNISAADDRYLTTVSAAAAATTPVAGSPAGHGWRSTWVGRHRVGVFLILAFALSWWTWPLTVLSPESSAQVSFGPIIAAFLVAAVAVDTPRSSGCCAPSFAGGCRGRGT